MGFMLRVRMASFFAGAAAAAAGGGYFLYKDYLLAHDSTALKVRPAPPPRSRVSVLVRVSQAHPRCCSWRVGEWGLGKGNPCSRWRSVSSVNKRSYRRFPGVSGSS
jgi:hypothetical protein